MMRQAWIEKGDAVAVVQQCVLAGVSRATIYAQQTPRPVDDGDLLLSRLIDEEYTWAPLLWQPQDGDLPPGMRAISSIASGYNV
jgi:hypothetical protein